MCGIVGYIGYSREGQWRETRRLLQEMLIASERRGRDATGFAALTEPLDDPRQHKVVLSKQPIPASEFVRADAAFQRLRHQRCAALIAHVRAATHGEPDTGDNRNNHPFSSWDHRFHLVHNGVISDHREAADRHSLRLESDCDSEILLRLVESASNPFVGLYECLRQLSGSMAVAVLDAHGQAIWLARNRGRPLWLAKLQRRWFFASTAGILIESFRRVLGAGGLHQLDYLAPIAADAPLSLSPNGRVFAPPQNGDS